MAKIKVLIIGGSGYLGKRLVKASLSQGHETYILHRPEIGVDIEKVEMIISFKLKGAHLVQASFNDHQSLVDAVKLVDVVVCAISGVHIRSRYILLQLNLIEAIKEAGNVKRFLPSEFGMDPARMGHAMEPGRVTFDDKMVVRKAIEEANIPFTYISANCFAGYFLGGLCQFGKILPPTEGTIVLHGDGNQKGTCLLPMVALSKTFGPSPELAHMLFSSTNCSGNWLAIYVDEDDIATYSIKTIDDPRTLNKTIYIRPPENVLSQREVVEIWEKLIGKELQKISISQQEFLELKKGLDYGQQVGLSHYYHVCYEGCLANFEVSDDEEASKLYPQVRYTSVEDYLNRYV